MPNGPVPVAGIMGPFLCPDCLEGLVFAASPCCTRCGAIFHGPAGDDHLCEDCIRAPKRFDRARAVGLYAQSLMVLIHQFKYHGKVDLARPLGGLMLLGFHQHFGDAGIDRVLPVPLHRKRFRSRGFNQAYMLIRHWPRICTTIPVIDRDTLVRKRQTEPQTGLGKKARIKNMRNAFQVRDAEKIAGSHLLLVDDVYTTGATVDACAGVLLDAGADRVSVLTLARVPTP